jgi:hypothetical protein
MESGSKVEGKDKEIVRKGKERRAREGQRIERERKE